MKTPPRSLGSARIRAKRSFLSRRVVLPAQSFLHTEGVGGIALLLAAVAGLAWANSPWRETYEALWELPVEFRLGRFGFHLDLREVINDGLMAVFFYVVGVEIKREMVEGDLSSPRRAALPVLAALGGMIAPALIYAACNLGTPNSKGWGVPMATDIAFALGALLALGRRVPASLRAFLLALAVADDLGAIAVIAVFYGGALSWSALGVAAGLLAVVLLMRWGGIRSSLAYLPVSVLFWAAILRSGVHATVAGVVLGLLAPKAPWFSLYTSAHAIQGLSRRFRSALRVGNFDRAEALMGQLEELSRGTEPPLDRRLRLLHPWASLVILPLFALANTGIELSPEVATRSLGSRTAWGVALGLLLGKPLGIVLFSGLAVRLGWASLPRGVRWPHLIGVGQLAGIGFTVSLFIARLAFADGPALVEAKLAILVTSVVAAALGTAILAAQPAGAEASAAANHRGDERLAVDGRVTLKESE